MVACDQFVPNPPGQSYTQPCIGVTWTQFYPMIGNCFLHYAIYDITYGSSAFLSAKMADYPIPYNLSVSQYPTTTAAGPTAATTIPSSSAAYG